MAGERTFLQVPPDSTGKRVRMTHTAEVFYTNGTPNYDWDIGQMYTTQFSDGNQYTMHVHGFHRISATSGLLEVHYNKAAKYDNLSPNVGADIIDRDGVTKVAEVQSVRDVYINSNHIIGYDNPENGVDVDPTGSMNVRFAEGLPQLDAFGKLRTSGASILGDYTFANNNLPSEFATTKFGSGKSVHNDDLHAAELRTGAGTATKNFGPDSDRIQLTTHTYHHYFPGLSQMSIMTVALSDQGQTGVMREWGYFDGQYDDDVTGTPNYELVTGNGIFFRVTGESGLQCVIRSSATGVVTETIISKDTTTKLSIANGVTTTISTLPDGWNGDPIDGSGDSQKVFDLRNDNIYWMDIQWLGAGRVRFGTYHRGQRIVIHEYYHDNNGGVPICQTGSLPLRYCQHNMKNINVVSESLMRVWCASVFTEANLDTASLGRGQTEYFKAVIDPANMNDVQGLNDGFGDRQITTKTGITSSGTTLTVPNLTGIKPGWIVKIASGTGVMQEETRVADIVNSTTIVVDKAPTTAIINTDDVTFEMPVNDEYYLIGILAPRPIIKGVNHENRTLYLPRSARAYAYHEDGAEAFISVQVYINPVMSGVTQALPLYDETELADFGVDSLFSSVEPGDPFSAVMAYGKDGIDKVNLFRESGIHGLVTYSGGYAGQEDLSGAFTTLQSAFKNLGDRGGNNRCPILKVYQSRTAGEATVIQINTPPTGIPFSLHREGNAVQLDNIPGVIGTATDGQNLYLRMIDNDKAELYFDKTFQTPLDTSAVDNSTNSNSLTWPGNTGSVATGGFIASGYGPYTYFSVLAKPQGPSKGGTAYQQLHGKIEVNFSLFWNEIIQ